MIYYQPTQKLPIVHKVEVWYTSLYTVVAASWEVMAELGADRKDWEKTAEYVMRSPSMGPPAFHDLGHSNLHLFVGKTGDAFLEALEKAGAQVVKTSRPCHRFGDDYWMKTNGIERNWQG